MSKSFRSRMGAAVRRSSTMFSSRPTTPSRSSSEVDVSSIRSASATRLDTHNLSPPEPEARKIVSPIAESPMTAVPPLKTEEPNLTQQAPSEPEAPSGSRSEDAAPVIEDNTNATSQAEQKSVHEVEAPAPPAPEPEVVEPPKPVGMFTDEPEAMSVHTKDDDRNVTSAPEAPVDVPHTESPTEEAPPVPSTAYTPPPGAFTDSFLDLPPVVVAEPPSYDTKEPSPIQEAPRAPSPAPEIKVEEVPAELPVTPISNHTTELPVLSSSPLQASPNSISYINLPQHQEPEPVTKSNDAFRHSIEQNVWGAHSGSSEDVTYPDRMEPTNGAPIMPVAQNGHADHKMPEAIALPQPQHQQAPDESYQHPPIWKNVSAKSSSESLVLNRGQPETDHKHIVVVPNEGILYDDPFADPVPVPPVVTIQSAEVPPMPQPEYHNGHAYKIDAVPSTHSYNHQPPEVNERMPLLAQSMTPQLSTYSYTNNNHMPVVSSGNGSISSAQQLHQLGWIEYALPDGTRYYVHPTLRVTTDVDLRDPRLLQMVSDHLELGVDYQGGKYDIHKDYELWLRNVGQEDNVQLSRCWVNHGKKRVSLTAPHVLENEDGPSNRDADDLLDMEYRYWAYMESHPAHIDLPHNATSEAMEALTWSYTEQLLPSDHQDSAPFSQSECQELMSLLRSFGDSSSGPSPVKSRVVARIHIRSAQWRQAHFRPDKPLPADVPFVHGARHLNKRTPLGKAVADVLISCLCFGIPYLLFHRSHRRMDVEGGLFRPPNSGPVLVVGACTCLVAAVVLSASVTFLSLPGMDHFARIAAVVSILFSASSMVSSVVALFRYKAEVDRAMVVTQALIGEGMMYEYRRSVVLSLPLVFLVYAIIGFVAGIVLYSFRGVETTNPLFILRQFDEYTRWLVIGFFGGLAGIITTLALTNHH